MIKSSMYPMVMRPYFSSRPWGGTMLESKLDKHMDTDEIIGESWELSDHPNGRSVVDNGPYAGQFFGDVLRAYPEAMMGRSEVPERYPLLIKFIDAAEDLSIQVHPDDHYAAKFHDRGKTECWYVMDCEKDTELIFGLKDGMTKEDLAKGCETGEIEQQVGIYNIEPNDFFFVRTGTVHAIRGGTLICEIQQSSDTTFRLWDWNRKPARELHIQESLDVIDFDARDAKPTKVPSTGHLETFQELTDNEYFRVQVADVAPNSSLGIPEDIIGNGLIVIILSGQGEITGSDFESVPVKKGITVYIPSELKNEFSLMNKGNEAIRFLIAESRE